MSPRSASGRFPAGWPGRSSAGRLWRWYGASPGHLLALLACFALTGYAAARVVQAGPWPMIALWFVGAAVVHDALLYPLYALADATLRGRRRSGPPHAVSWRNHVAVPAACSGLLLLLWFPLILGRSEPVYRAATGLSTDPYLARWLLVTGVLFAGSALVYGYRLRRQGRLRSGRSSPNR